jgi:hypothetical protein
VTIGSHQQTVGKSQTHLTPRWIIDALGPFDLDPCAADPRPWDCATVNWSEADDGLSRVWRGRVWMNPPFDRYAVETWCRRLAEHGDGIALLHARTETDWFGQCWGAADAMLFLSKRIKFLRPDGTEQPANSGAPVVLVSFGDRNVDALRAIPGWLVRRWERIAA